MAHKVCGVRTVADYLNRRCNDELIIRDVVKSGCPTDLRIGDSRDLMRQMPESSVSLIITSPPYGNARAGVYCGAPEEDYFKWFGTFLDDFKRVLRPDGSLVVNFGSRHKDGRMSLYIMKTVIHMEDRGFRLVAGYAWVKKNIFPGADPFRLRKNDESIYHFTLNKAFKIRKDRLMVLTGNWYDKRMAKIGKGDDDRHESNTNSGFGRKVASFQKEMADDTSTQICATVCRDKGHSAAWPEAIPFRYIQLFSDPGDIVLDPFVGSGTTCRVASMMGRPSVGMDLEPWPVLMDMKKNFSDVQWLAKFNKKSQARRVDEIREFHRNAMEINSETHRFPSLDQYVLPI